MEPFKKTINYFVNNLTVIFFPFSMAFKVIIVLRLSLHVFFKYFSRNTSNKSICVEINNIRFIM